MIDPNFTDPEKAHQLHVRKLEQIKNIMDKIVNDPGSMKVEDLQKAINFSDKSTTNSVTDQ